MTEFVKTKQEVRDNLETLIKYRMGSESESSFYLGGITKGRHFVAIEIDGQLEFGPSKFLGYKNMTLDRYEELRQTDLPDDVRLDGKKSTPILEKILGKSEFDAETFEQFKDFCQKHDIDFNFDRDPKYINFFGPPVAIADNFPQKALIERYKRHIRSTQLKDETYKWGLIEKFQGRPNPNSESLLEEIKSVEFKNLIYAMGIAVLHHLAKDKPEELRVELGNLFDESLELTERIKTYNRVALKMYRSLGETLQHHQDERTIATLLTYRDPDKYTFYKYSFYRKYCKLLGLNQAAKNEKYPHYLSLINQFIENYITKDKELIELVKQYIPEYDGTNHLILAQDILFQTLENTNVSPLSKNHSEMKYWIYAPGEGARKWDEFYDQKIMALGWDDLGDLEQYESKEDIAETLRDMWGVSSSKMNDAHANWEFAHEMQPGDKVFVKKGRKELLGFGVVKSDYRFDANRNEYQSIRDVDWKQKGHWQVDHNLVMKTLTDITRYASEHESYEKYSDLLMAVIKGSYQTKNEEEASAINMILYGPPGTGKTYSTKAYAVSLGETGNIQRAEEWLDSEERTYINSWKQLREEERIEFVTFHQSFAYEDFVQGIRPDVSSTVLSFDRHNGVFKTISDKARKNYEQSISGERKSFGTFDEIFNSFMSGMLQEEETEIEIPMRSKGYYFTITGYDPDDGRMNFKKKSGGTGHDLLVKNLKKIYEGTLDYGIDGLGVYYYPFVDRLKQFAIEKQKQTPVQPLKHYVLIIDEINRANISRVLGELITLLEPDKRLGQDDELIVKLPSGESFGVPPNLHIIGTMNTADKSIAHLDVALRRRFKFKPMYPDASLAGDYSNLLIALNAKIENQLNPELTIGHSFFMNDDPIEQIMNDKVIPLMLEYFNHRTEDVISILKSVGIKLGETTFGIPHCIGYEPAGK